MFDICAKSRTKQRDSFESRHTDRVSVRIKVQTAAQRELTRADALGHASIKQRCEIQCEAFEFSDEHKCLGDLN